MMDEDTARMILGDETATKLQEILCGLIMGTKKLVIDSKLYTDSRVSEYNGERIVYENEGYTHTFRIEDASSG